MITMRFDPDLAVLAGGAEVVVPGGVRRAVKDLLASVGVPHPEIDVLVVDGRSVTLGHVVDDEVEILAWGPNTAQRAGPPAGRALPSLQAAPVPHVPVTHLWPQPPEPRRFVLDVHLGVLARRLRLLGFDTWYRTDADDPLLAELAVTDGRILLTRDRQLLGRRAIVHGYLPRADHPDTQAQEVVARYDLAPHAEPGTRCVRCNGLLEDVEATEVAHRVPPRTRAAFDTYRRCVRCSHVYWPGSHQPAIDRFLASVGVARSR